MTNPTAALAERNLKEARLECERRRLELLETADKMRRLANNPDPAIASSAKRLLDQLPKFDKELLYIAKRGV